MNFNKKIDEECQNIRDGIMAAGTKFRRRHPWVEKYQDWIGLGLTVAAAAVTLLGAYMIDAGISHYWVGFIVVVLATSILHEIEHDSIHDCYFPHTWMQDAMLLACALLRPTAPSPWGRKRLHFHHHVASGVSHDLEERSVGNGMPWGPRRLLMLFDTTLGFMLRPIEIVLCARGYRKNVKGGTLSFPEQIAVSLENIFLFVAPLPIGLCHYCAMWLWFSYGVVSNGWVPSAFGLNTVITVDLFHRYLGFAIPYMPYVARYVWAIGLPNTVRQGLLALVSSNMHYHYLSVGDVKMQTQIWNSWWLLPIDLVTCYFGATHSIHHFVVRDPFYIRHLIRHECWKVMVKNGVRMNDFDTFRRANAWELAAPTNLGL